MYYADLIKRNFPKAINTGPDIGAFTRGLQAGKKGSYFGVPQEEYEQAVTSAQNAIPQEQQLPFNPTAQPAAESGEDGDMVTAPAPPPSAALPPESDKSGASGGERFLSAAIGTGIGTVASGAQAYGAQKTATAVKRAGLEEAAKIVAQRNAGVIPPVSGGLPGSTPSGQGVVRQPTLSGGANAGPLNTSTQSSAGARPSAPGSVIADAGYLAKGETGVQVYNTAKGLGFTDIEAAKFVKEGATAKDVYAAAEDIRSAGFKKIRSSFPSETWVENPQYSGITTLDQGGGGGPRASFKVQGPTIEVPPGQMGPPVTPPQPGSLVELPRPIPVPTTPPPPTMTKRALSGLDYVTDLFKDLMRPVVGAVGTVGKYALPPIAGLSAGLDAMEMAHEYEKPENQRDYTKMALKGTGIVGGALSMFPPTAAIGIPLSLGATAIQEYRDDPEYYNQKMREYVTDREAVAQEKRDAVIRARRQMTGQPMR
jgi:cold shock CspA family protein